MKNILSFCTLLSLIGFGFAQTYELQRSSRPSSAQGPVYSTDEWTFEPTTLAGDVTVSVAYSNQQYTLITTDYDESGMMFGATSTDYDAGQGKFLTEENIYDALGSVGSPEDSDFSASENQIGTGMDASGSANGQNGAFIQYNSVEGIATQSGVDVTDGEEFYMGDVTYTFSQPVDDPVIHVSGLGGQSITGTSSDNAEYLWFSTDLELTGSSASYTMTRLSGTEDPNPGSPEGFFFDVDGTTNRIVNRFGDGSYPLFPDEDGTKDYHAGSGSVLIEGDGITEISFKVIIRAKSDGRWTQDDMYAGDLYTVSWSFDESICTANPAVGTPEPTYVGISTLDRNVNEWLKEENNENLLGAYVAMESTNKAFVVSRNSNPGPYKGETAAPTDNIQNPVEGMVVWDSTKNCLSLYKVDESGDGYWSCVSLGCNQ